MSYFTVKTVASQGLQTEMVRVEADVSNGLPVFLMVGYLSSEVKEASERVRTAIRNAGYMIPPKRIVVNLSPANVRKRGTAFDLPIAIAILAALGVIPVERLKETLFIGDSNTEGISAYGFLPLQYVLGSTGMPIQGVTKTRCIYFYGYDQPVTMATAVGMLKPRRVILSFGTNNAGGTTTKDFIKNYETAIAAIEKSYPHCDIIVESILPVKKNRSYPDIKKEDIDEFNLALAKMCKDKGYMFLNSAEIFKGKDGYAKNKYFSNDGIHMNTDGYKALLEYVENHKYITKDSRPRRGQIPQRREAPVVSSEPQQDNPVPIESRSVSPSSAESVASSSSVRSSSQAESQSSVVISSSESSSTEVPASSSETVISQPEAPSHEAPPQDSVADNTTGGEEENGNAPAEETPTTENETQG